MAQLTTAGRLLHDLHDENPPLRDQVIQAAGIPRDKAIAAIAGARLSLAEQLRLAEAVTHGRPATCAGAGRPQF
jgi:hypothetical protein